ncbi:uncharacterized protein LOC108811265 [Raphanus sativus]|uniref:Uncharacterized protein LOC108811265 n=1 Tax=Raphanus sativus TaxID=3726 RepID=A0A6J0JT00_RAPSA|nr:uncharacterized protein LOC108811265 [Raphanus sativus]
MASIMKIMMSMALLVIGVNAMSIDECKRTTGCQNQCDLFYRSVACGDCLLQCAYPLSTSKIDKRALCFRNCDVARRPHNNCYQRCIE